MIEPTTITPRSTLPALSVGLLALVFSCFLTIGVTAQALNLPWGIFFAEIFIFLGIPYVVVRLTGRDALRLAGARGLTAKGAGYGFAIGFVNYFAWAVPLMYLAERLFPKRWVDQFDSSQIFKGQTPLELAVIVLGVSTAAPLCEEFLFRGVVQVGLTRALDAPRAVVTTALIFSVFHLDPVGLLARFELGVVFGLLAWRSGSFWPAVFAHAANNLISSLAWLASDGASEDDLAWWVPLVMWAVGNALLLGLVTLARRRAALVVSEPSAEVRTPRPTFIATAGPWLVAAFGAVALLASLDFRGAVLSVYDQLHPMSSPGRTASPAELTAINELTALRRRARAGEVPLDDYFDLRRLASDDKRTP